MAFPTLTTTRTRNSRTHNRLIEYERIMHSIQGGIPNNTKDSDYIVIL